MTPDQEHMTKYTVDTLIQNLVDELREHLPGVIEAVMTRENAPHALAEQWAHSQALIGELEGMFRKARNVGDLWGFKEKVEAHEWVARTMRAAAAHLVLCAMGTTADAVMVKVAKEGTHGG